MMAVQFLTRVPVPPLDRLGAEEARVALGRATAWLPPVGSLIGLTTAGTYLLGATVWPPLVAAIVAMALEAWLTGAFHEDAVADFCDAFGGQARYEEALRILKDSRIGSYGALGLVLFVMLRTTTTAALPPDVAVAAIVGAATMARLWAVMLLALVPPAPATRGLAKDIGGLPRGSLVAAVALATPGLAGLALAAPAAIPITLAAGILILLGLAAFLRRRIGGSTGDCLGFAAYLGQVSLLLATVALG